MFFNNKDQKLDHDVLKNQLAFQELLLQMDGINQEIDGLLKELNVTRHQLEAFLSNPDNFTSDNWVELQKQRQILEEKLKCEIANVRDPRKTKQAQSNRRVEQHWLYVK